MLSLYEKVYRELDVTNIGAEHGHHLKAKRGERYDPEDEIGIDYKRGDWWISIRVGDEKRLNFAKKVAEYYKVEYVTGENRRVIPEQRYFISINTEE